MDLAQARAALAQVPWIRDVALAPAMAATGSKSPSTSTSRSRASTTAQLVNTRGEVFAAESREELPQFEGPEARAAEMADRYRAWSEALRPLALRLSRGAAVAARRLAAEGGRVRKAR